MLLPATSTGAPSSTNYLAKDSLPRMHAICSGVYTCSP